MRGKNVNRATSKVSDGTNNLGISQVFVLLSISE